MSEEEVVKAEEDKMEIVEKDETKEKKEIKKVPEKKAQTFIKPGKVVIILQGRHAGSKAVVLKNVDKPERNKYDHSHAYVCGISKYPKLIRKKMTKKQIERKTRFRCFLKRIGYTHILPTRYGLDIKNFPKVEDNDFEKCLTDPSTKRGKTIEFHKALNEKFVIFVMLIFFLDI